jgi:hypothetical protein
VLNKAQYSSDVIALAVLWRLRYKLSLRDLAEMFLTRGFIFTYEAVREWEAKLTPALAENLRRKRKGRIGLRQTAMTPIPGRSGQSSAGRCDIGRVAISTTDLSRTIAASKADVGRCWDWKAHVGGTLFADTTTNCATSFAADPGCANMLLLRRSAGSTCGRRRLHSTF